MCITLLKTVAFLRIKIVDNFLIYFIHKIFYNSLTKLYTGYSQDEDIKNILNSSSYKVMHKKTIFLLLRLINKPMHTRYS